jgi:hypothetical protein
MLSRLFEVQLIARGVDLSYSGALGNNDRYGQGDLRGHLCGRWIHRVGCQVWVGCRTSLKVGLGKLLALRPAVETRRGGRPDERQSAGEDQAGSGMRADRLERALVQQGEPASPAGAGLSALPAFPTTLAGEFGKDKGSPG